MSNLNSPNKQNSLLHTALRDAVPPCITGFVANLQVNWTFTFLKRL